jgi:hypothetical protein
MNPAIDTPSQCARSRRARDAPHASRGWPCHAGALAVVLLLTSCASSALPPALSKAERATLSERPLPYTVGVETYKYSIYSDKLAEALKASGAFRQAGLLSELEDEPDWIATVEDTVHGTAVIPAITFATLGLVPTMVKERHGFKFSLAPALDRKRKTMVDATYSGLTTLGWAAIPINLLPGYTGGDPDASERVQEMLAYQVISAVRGR